MIIKDKERTTGRQLDATAGAAFDKMSEYLKKTFADSPTVLVLNDLRVEHEGDSAVIDHLVIYPEGFVVVDSTSVTSPMKVNDRGEWERRLQNGAWQGCASPVEQALLKFRTLWRLLNPRAPDLLKKFGFVIQKGFGAFAEDVVVAIPDAGCVERPGGEIFWNVLKADMVPAHLRQTMEHKSKGSTFRAYLTKPSDQLTYTYSQEEIHRIAIFLRDAHSSTSEQAPAISGAPAKEEKDPSKRWVRPGRYFCARCKTTVPKAVAEFCWAYPKRFETRVYCRTCQKDFQ